MVGPKSNMTGVLVERMQRHKRNTHGEYHIKIHKGRISREDRDRDWIAESASKERIRIVSHNQKQGRD